MNVLILTHALGQNYGGILQAYALQEVIKRHGINVVTTNYQEPSRLTKSLINFKYLIRIIVHTVKPMVSDLPPYGARLYIPGNLRFIKLYMNTVSNSKLIDNHFLKTFDLFIVGSDQVWRQAYVPVAKYMFNFAEDLEVKRISYAASFGTNDLSEYSPELIEKTAQLAKKFEAISVREDTGKYIVRKNWGIKAEQHVDPTLLLSKDHYESLITEDSLNLNISKGNLFVYVLDKSDSKEKIINRITQTLMLAKFEILPPTPTSRRNLKNNLEKYQLPPLTQWLKSFQDADYIVTDSFHGTVFAIIFNKPFLAIGNKSRGMTRFTSLLNLFGLKDRLVLSRTEVTEELIRRKIDWVSVNKIIKIEQKRSHDFLIKYLRDDR